jgi:hypothetical protein
VRPCTRRQPTHEGDVAELPGPLPARGTRAPCAEHPPPDRQQTWRVCQEELGLEVRTAETSFQRGSLKLHSLPVEVPCCNHPSYGNWMDQGESRTRVVRPRKPQGSSLRSDLTASPRYGRSSPGLT